MTGSRHHKSVVVLSLLLSACQTIQTGNENDRQQENGFSIKSVAKSDANMVLDKHVTTLDQYLEELMLKLYLRNPYYWRVTGDKSAQAKVDRLLSETDLALSKRVQNTRSTQSIQLAFDPLFGGDRVLAFVYGLKSMLLDAYGGRKEFFILDQLDPQKLYNAARNIEVAVWKLSNDRFQSGQLYLISNALDGEVKNLSFERLFGKMIAIQDSSAFLVADSTNRVIKNVLQGVARYVFLPI